MTQPLRIGFDVPFQPFALMIDGKPGGMLLELVAEIMARAGLAYEWVPLTLDETEPALYAGKVDALGLKGITPERHATMDFSGSLVLSGSALFRRPDLRETNDPHDFPGLRIVTPRRGPLIKQLEKHYPELVIVPVDSYETSFETLLSGGADLAALNFHAGTAMAKQHHAGKVGLPTAPYAALDIAFCVAKGKHADMLAKFNAALAQLKAEGRAAAIEKKWLGG